MRYRDLLQLAGLVFVSVSLVVVGDTAGKLLTGGGIAPGFVAWSRFAVGALLIWPLTQLSRADLPGFRDWRVLLRAGLIMTGIVSILTALRSEPIANVFGAFFIGPIVSYGLAVVFLGERPARARAALLALGFVGVLLVVQPGAEFRPGMIFALLAGCCYGGYLAMTRLVAGRYRPRFLLFSQLALGAVALAPIGLAGGWPSLSGETSLLILLSALGSAVGNYLLVRANRGAEASLIAPLIYTQLISATLAGIAVFGDWPTALTLVGLGIILASGLASLWIVAKRGR